MSEVVSGFIDAMRDAGAIPSDPSEIIADDTIRRFHIDGDRRGVKNGVYQLFEDDGFGAGWFINHKEGVTHSWHSKVKRKWTDEERKEHKRKIEAAKKRRHDQRMADAAAARDEAARLWGDASKSGRSDYLERKGIDLKGVRYTGDVLLVPMYRDGEMVSVQRILPDGTKLFLKNSDHVGAYFSIGRDVSTIVLCEGVATGQVVHNATGWAVICAFNAGNLKPVSQSIRKKYPDARILIAADNDHEVKRQNGDPFNVGVEKAKQAAVAIGGCQIVIPECEAGESDWDDIARKSGLDAVKDAFISVPAPKPVDDGDDGEWEQDFDDLIDDNNSQDPMDIIRPLGHNRGEFYFFPRTGGQILKFTATALGRPQNLYQLAPRSFWEAMYAPEQKMSVIADCASGQLIEMCQARGIFEPDMVRGVGVWRDRGGKLLVNCGDMIVGEGVRCHPSEYKAEYVYEAGRRVIDMDAAPLTNTEAARFRTICKSLSWKRPQHGDLLAGWCVIAAVGGALDWRPHIFITGRKGSGKSTAMDKIVHGSLHGIVIKRDGGTTEAGIRKAISASSRPFMMDEAEAESGNRRSQMQLIFEYFRNASSGAVVENAYSTYVARSAACFGAINPRIEQGADADRWSMLELIPNESDDRDDQYKSLLTDIGEVITRDFPNRLLVRTVANLDVLLHNIGVFVDVFSKKLGSKRAGDQIGTLIAGSHSLVSNRRVDYAFVEKWVAGQDWEFGELTGGGSDAEALVGYIMSARIRYDHDGMGRESSIGNLVSVAAGYEGDKTDSAIKGLASYGIKIEGDRLVISNSSPRIKEILRDTPWGVWKRTLGDFVGADNCENRTVYFGPGVKTKATSVPLRNALGIDVSDDDGFEMEGFE